MFRDWDLTIDGPGLVLVTGPNGSGKSTLLELLSGYLRPQRGTVHIGGHPAGSVAARARRRVCRAAPALHPQMTADDHLSFASRNGGTDHAEAAERFARYGGGAWLDTAAGSLSTGNTRKLWLVMCTLGEADTVILDEPFNGLDADGADTLRAEITEWAARRQVILISHTTAAGLPRPVRVIALSAATHAAGTPATGTATPTAAAHGDNNAGAAGAAAGGAAPGPGGPRA